MSLKTHVMRKMRVVEMTKISLLLPRLSTLMVVCQNLMVKILKSVQALRTLEDSYDKLCEKYLRLNKVNKRLSTKLRNQETECTKIAQELSEALANLIQMKSDNDTCFEQLKCCLVEKQKIACELSEAKQLCTRLELKISDTQ